MVELTEAFNEKTDGALRIIAMLDSMNYEFQYVRDDVASQYSEQELEEMYLSIMSNLISADDLSKIASYGGVDAQMIAISDKLAFFFPSSRYKAVFVSFDRTESFPVMEILDMVDEFPQLLGSD